MTAKSMTRSYDEYRRNRIAPNPACPAAAPGLRYAILHALALFGLGVGGMTAVGSEEPPGIG